MSKMAQVFEFLIDFDKRTNEMFTWKCTDKNLIVMYEDGSKRVWKLEHILK